MRKVFALFVAIVVLSLASVALAERGNVGGVGVFSDIRPWEHGCIGGVGCTTQY